jgi:hypothetical protein
MLNDRDLRQVVGDEGKRYSLVSYALDDGDDRVRLVVAVDYGGLSAGRPLCGARSCGRTVPWSTGFRSPAIRWHAFSRRTGIAPGRTARRPKAPRPAARVRCERCDWIPRVGRRR